VHRSRTGRREENGRVQFFFEQNQGQADSQVAYLLRRRDAFIYFLPAEVVMASQTRSSRIRFVGGCSTKEDVHGVDALPGKSNYLIGDDPSGWLTDVPHFEKLHYSSIYPGIDMLFYENDGLLEFDWIIAPGVDPGLIKLEFAGMDNPYFDEAGNCVLSAGIRLRKPFIYQTVNNQCYPIEGEYYLLESGQLGIQLYEAYNPELALIIDPVLEYSTFLGGDGAMEHGYANAVDSEGNAYITGITNAPNYPTTPGVVEPIFSGITTKAFATKISPTGTLIYSTFIGGRGSEIGYGIAVDALGQVFVAGRTQSPDFPSTAGSFQPKVKGSYDAFLVKLNATASAFIYATCLGGSASDEARALTIDGAGNAYVTGFTASTNFPVTSGAFQTTLLGIQSIFVTKMNPTGSALVYSTYLGATSYSYSTAITIDGDNNAYIGGYTYSPNYPVTAGVFQDMYAGGSADAILTKLNATGTGLIYSTFFGTVLAEYIQGVTLDSDRNAYVVGYTESPDFPVTPGVFMTTAPSEKQSIFITKFNVDASVLLYSTYFGASLINVDSVVPTAANYGYGIALDALRNVYITGSTTGIDLPVTSDAFQPQKGEGSGSTYDVFISVLGPNADELKYSTYFGGVFNETGYAIKVDASGNIYISGFTSSDNFPLRNPIQFLKGAGNDVVAIKFIGPLVSKTSDRSSANIGDTVHFTLKVENTGQVTLTNLTVVEDLPGATVIPALVPTLLPLSTQSFIATFTVPAGTSPGPLLNTATIFTDQTPQGMRVTSTLNIIGIPSFLAVKSVAPANAAPGETVVFTITIVNDGEVTLTNVTVTDPLLGFTRVYDQVIPGASIVENLPFVIPADAEPGFSVVNTATVSADQLAAVDITAAVNVLAVARATIRKRVNPSIAPPGNTVTFIIDVTNSGNVPLTNILVSDFNLGLTEIIPSLIVGQSIQRTVPFLIPFEVPAGTYTNTVTAVSDQTPAPVEDTAQLTIQSSPMLGVSKVADRIVAAPGETINYSIFIANFGNVPLTGLTAFDSLLSVDERFLPDLAVGEIRSITAPFSVPVDAIIGSKIINDLTVTTSEIGITRVQSVVTVINTQFVITKLADKAIAIPGETITYSITIANNSPDTQTNIVISDPLVGLTELIPSLLPGETITLSAAFVIPIGTASGSVITNIVQIGSDQTATQNAAAETVVQTDPLATTSLVLIKLPDRDIAGPGETIIFSINVFNTGANPAANIVITDQLTGTSDTIASLAPGRSAVIQVPFTIPADADQGTPFVNTATAASPQLPIGVVPISNSSVVSVGLRSDFLALTNVVSKSIANPGETVLFTITVSNTSTRTLTNVRVLDPLTLLSASFSELASGESRVFLQPFTIPTDAVGHTVFVSRASAFSDQTPLQQAAASVTVAALPKLLLEESVDPSSGHPGDIVIFTIRLRNTGNVAAINGVLTAPLLRFQSLLGVFEVGADQTIRIPFVLPDIDEERRLLTSIVTVTSDNVPTVQASASVVVIEEQEE
jgi:uncharacterized repeat protein (TIGR01451 family)